MTSNWAIHIAHALWQSTIAALVVLAFVRIARNASPRLRHAIVMIGLIKFALPPMLPLPTGVFSAAPPVGELTTIRDFASSIRALMYVHLAGIAIAMIRLVLVAARLHRLRRGARLLAMEENVPILASPTLTVPMTLGVFKPAILIPEALLHSLSASELQVVIAHELRHVRRGDVLLNWLQALLGTIWWFDPFYRLLSAEARALREECCDDELIAGGTLDRARYARTLLHAATFAGRTAPAAGIGETTHSLLTRVRRLADPGFSPRRRLTFGALVLIALVALTLLPGLRVSRSNRFAFDHATRHALHH
ncbi:MAG TPA: M56 family metallopeptidase [Thermoanaerobaculia bacterium]|nr:M56 family metallopeptidase [Thermoanaerobaculia bacterium]